MYMYVYIYILNATVCDSICELFKFLPLFHLHKSNLVSEIFSHFLCCPAVYAVY